MTQEIIRALRSFVRAGSFLRTSQNLFGPGSRADDGDPFLFVAGEVSGYAEQPMTISLVGKSTA